MFNSSNHLQLVGHHLQSLPLRVAWVVGQLAQVQLAWLAW